MHRAAGILRIYSTLGEAEGAAALRTIVRRYMRGFAARCGLTLADEGTVPTLFVAHWYDDGALPWAHADEATPGATLAPRGSMLAAR